MHYLLSFIVSVDKWAIIYTFSGFANISFVIAFFVFIFGGFISFLESAAWYFSLILKYSQPLCFKCCPWFILFFSLYQTLSYMFETVGLLTVSPVSTQICRICTEPLWVCLMWFLLSLRLYFCVSASLVSFFFNLCENLFTKIIWELGWCLLLDSICFWDLCHFLLHHYNYFLLFQILRHCYFQRHDEIWKINEEMDISSIDPDKWNSKTWSCEKYALPITKDYNFQKNSWCFLEVA